MTKLETYKKIDGIPHIVRDSIVYQWKTNATRTNVNVTQDAVTIDNSDIGCKPSIYPSAIVGDAFNTGDMIKEQMDAQCGIYSLESKLS